jgi:hypothetical protein
MSHKGDWAEVRTASGSGWVHRKGFVSAQEAASTKDNGITQFEHPPSPVTAPNAHGTIYVEADVNTDGEVTNTILVTNTTGSVDLAEKNMSALKHSKFYPIIIRGERKPFSTTTASTTDRPASESSSRSADRGSLQLVAGTNAKPPSRDLPPVAAVMLCTRNHDRHTHR